MSYRLRQAVTLSLAILAATSAFAGDTPREEPARGAAPSTPTAPPSPPTPSSTTAPSSPTAQSSPTGPSPASAQPAPDGDAKAAPAAQETARAAPKPSDPPLVRAPTPRTLDDALRTLARRRCDVDFAEAPMADVVTFLSRLSGLNVLVSAELRRESGGALPAVTLKLAGVSLRQVAEMVARTTGSELVVRDGVLQFTTPKDARGSPILRIFPIAELTMRIRNFPGPDIQLHTGDSKFVQEEETDEPGAFDDPATVADLVKRFTGKGTWEDEGVSIAADDRKIVVRQYPKVMKEISAFLALLRAAK